VGHSDPPDLAAGLRLGFTFGATVAFFWQLRNPVILFSWPLVNVILGYALALGLPWLLGVMVYRLRRGEAKAAAIVVALAGYSFLVVVGLIMNVLVIRGGRNLSFDQFSEAPWKRSMVRLYRTDSGALSGSGWRFGKSLRSFPESGLSIRSTISTPVTRSTL